MFPIPSDKQMADRRTMPYGWRPWPLWLMRLGCPRRARSAPRGCMRQFVPTQTGHVLLSPIHHQAVHGLPHNYPADGVTRLTRSEMEVLPQRG